MADQPTGFDLTAVAISTIVIVAMLFLAVHLIPALASAVYQLVPMVIVVWFIVIAHVVMSWLIGFNVLNRHQPLVRSIWDGLNRLLEPIYRPIRRVLPDMGGLDLSPLVLLVIIYAIQVVLQRNAAAFF